MIILCSIMSITSVSNIGLSASQYPAAVNWLQVFLTGASLASYGLTQYVAFQNYDNVIKSYTSYIQSIENFLSQLNTMIDVKSQLRPDGDTFILNNETVYANIFRNSPYLSQSEWEKAIAQYNIYLSDLNLGKNNYYEKNRHIYSKYIIDTSNQNAPEQNTSNQNTSEQNTPDHNAPECIISIKKD